MVGMNRGHGTWWIRGMRRDQGHNLVAGIQVERPSDHTKSEDPRTPVESILRKCSVGTGPN